MSNSEQWFGLIENAADPDGAQDKLYEELNKILDERVIELKQSLTQAGTSDFDPQIVTALTQVFHDHWKHSFLAGFAAVAVMRLARS